jgi:hypothetical protein
VAALLAMPAIVAAAQNRHFTADRLAGEHELPTPRITNAHGIAKFTVNSEGTVITYHVNVAQINNVTQAHIHLGPANGTGPVVAWLYPPGSTTAGPPGAGPSNGLLARGTITAANLVGPLAGQPLSALIDAMTAGNTYVNVHTSDGVDPPDTGPGDFPGGEVRNQIRVQGS